MSTNGITGDGSRDSSLGAVHIKDPRKQRKCPLCKQNLYLYNLNYEEMMLMCENVDCDFPFGYEALQVVGDESELIDKPASATEHFFMYPINESTPTIDSASTASLLLTNSFISDLDQPNLDSDFGAFDCFEDNSAQRKKHRLRQKRRDRNKEIERNVNSIKRLNAEMDNLRNNHLTQQIKTEKWLNNLKAWEESSGKKLLKEEEHKILKSNETFSVDDVKINVEPGSRLPIVSIEIFKNK